MSTQQEARLNTDREIWRGKSRAEFGDPGRFYADSLFIPARDTEALGINCGGMVIVKPIREWHALAAQPPVQQAEARLSEEQVRYIVNGASIERISEEACRKTFIKTGERYDYWDNFAAALVNALLAAQPQEPGSQAPTQIGDKFLVYSGDGTCFLAQAIRKLDKAPDGIFAKIIHLTKDRGCD